MDFDIHDRTPETKAGIPSHDAQDVYEAMMRTFEEYKSENDGRLKAIEERKGDVLNDEKLARIDAALNVHQQQLDAISLKDARPALEGRRAVEDASGREHKSAFDDYVRGGEAGGLRALEMKAMSIASNPDGGYLVPPELETEIGQRLANISPIRGLASVRAISSTVYKKPFMVTGPASGWVGETDPRTRPLRPCWTRFRFRRWSSTPCRRRPRRCWRIPPSISTSGWRARSTRCSPSRRAPPSSPATASTSRRDSWPTTVANASWSGAISAISQAAWPAPSRRRIPPTCWST
jgi:predicted phage gp36 major capsid-like protein